MKYGMAAVPAVRQLKELARVKGLPEMAHESTSQAVGSIPRVLP
jgi:hypothetical protein